MNRPAAGRIPALLAVAMACGFPAAAVAGTTTYTGTWGGGTILPGDTVLLNDGASVTGPVVADGTLQFNQTAALTMSTMLSGSGALRITNTGTFALAGLTSGTASLDLAASVASGRMSIGGTGTNPLVIGASGAGSLAVDGGWVSSGAGYLGLSAGSLGTATISSGSWTTSRKFLYVGFAGTGSLTVSGGLVANSSGVVGYPGGTGTASVTSGTWANSGPLYVGGYSSGSGIGMGTLTVSGGQVTDTFGYIGFGAGNVGAATVTGGTWANSVMLSVGSSGTGALTVAGGVVTSGSGIIASVATGVGTVTVTGGTWANAGGLVVGGAGTGTLTISGSDGTGGIVIVGGTLSRGVKGTILLGGGGTLQIGTGSAAGVLTTDLVNDGALVFNRTGSGTVSTIIGGTGSLTVRGGGTLTFSGANAYSGPTAVDAGALLVDGSLGGTAVSVKAGALLGGAGTIGGTITVSAGGTLAPGRGIESLGTGGISFTDGAIFAYDVNSSGTPTADLVVVAGNLALSGTVALALVDLAAAQAAFADGTTFSLLDYTGSWNGGLFTYGGAALADGATFLFADRLWAIDYDAASGGTNFSGEHLAGSRFVNIMAVPEPSTSALIVTFGACAGLRPRRRSRAPRGFTLVEILVVVAIVAVLASQLLPAVQSAREASRRTHCLNNLRQLGMGFHNFHAARGCFPTAVSGSAARHYWTAQILPYLDEGPLSRGYDYSVDCADARNRDVVLAPVPFVVCPSVPGEPRQDVKFIRSGSPTWPAAVSDYAASSGPSSTLWNAPPVVSFPKPSCTDGLFPGSTRPGGRGRRIGDVTDGASKSVALFECAGRPQLWVFGAMVPDSGLASSPASRYVGLCGWADSNQSIVRGFWFDASQANPAARGRSPGGRMVNGSNNLGIHACHPGTADVLFVDGSARALEESTAADVVAALLTIQGADGVGPRF